MGLIRSLARSRRGRRGRSSLVVVYNIIPEVIAAVEKNAQAVVQSKTREIAEDARSRAPVETGFLRSSVEGRSSGKEGEISVGAEYGPFVEFGTYKMTAQPFLQPAVSDHAEDFFEKVGKGAFKNF